MSQANMTPVFMEDQKDHDDTFASKDMSLLLITSIEYRDVTSTLGGQKYWTTLKIRYSIKIVGSK